MTSPIPPSDKGSPAVFTNTSKQEKSQPGQVDPRIPRKRTSEAQPDEKPIAKRKREHLSTNLEMVESNRRKSSASESGYSTENVNIDDENSDIRSLRANLSGSIALTDMEMHILKEIKEDLDTDQNMSDLYLSMLEGVYSFCHRPVTPVPQLHTSETMLSMAKSSMEYINSKGIKKPEASLDYRWPYAMPIELCKENDLRYLRKLTPLLRLVEHLVYTEASSNSLNIEQKNHLYSKLVAFVVKSEKLGKCGDKAHVVA